MSLRSRFSTWWKAVSRPSRLDNDVQEELSFHIESYAEDLMRNGLPREEALRRARVELGGLAAQKEKMRAAWGTRLWDELRGDLRYALRMLAKSPGFTAIAVGSLALGIGANTVIFTVAKHVLLDRLAVPHPEELRLFQEVQDNHSVARNFWGSYGRGTPDGKRITTSFSYPVYQILRRENRSFADIFAFKSFNRMTARMNGEAEAVTAEMVSGNYYSSLDVHPVLGRPIQDSDDGGPGSGPVVVISYRLWTTRFGQSPNVIGKVIDLNRIPVTIIGVNPPDFTGAFSTQSSPDVFLPFSMQPIVAPMLNRSMLADTEIWWVQIMGRVKSGVREEAARADLDRLLYAAVHATMHVGKDETVPHLRLADGSRGQNAAADAFSKPIYVLLALSGFVLLLACANLANLLLARAAARQREMSVRLALGAGRARILRQMLTESLLLSFFGGAAGLLLSYAGRNALPRLLSNSWEHTSFRSGIDWQILGFTASVSILTGLLFGLAPAWQATRSHVSFGLKNNAQAATHRRKGLGGKTLVVVQISLSMLLLVGAGLFVHTLVNLGNTHLGFRPDHLLLVNVAPPATRYPAPKDIALHRQIEEKFAAIPGVDSVTLTQEALLSGYVSSGYIAEPQKKDLQQQEAYWNIVGEQFFPTMGIPLVAGRGFTSGDTETSTKVAVINRQLAREFLPGTNPIGKTFLISGYEDQPVTIVGICGDTKYDSLRRDTPATFYLLYRQRSDLPGGMTYEISSRRKPSVLIPALRAAVQSVDKDLPLLDIRTQNEQIDAAMQQERIFADLTGGFGILALVLACIGIYGIMAYSVSRRINEIGIRMALGAQAGQVLRMVIREASWLAVIGVIAGLGGALALGRLIASMLFGLKAYDPVTLGSAGALLIAVALAASWVPARRAARVNPIQALRHE